MSKLKGVILGAGNRGLVYGRYALEFPDELEITAVADPNKERRESFADRHNIPFENQFETWEDCLAGKKLGDVVFNATMDQMHLDSTLQALDLGYHILLEKPMARTLVETVQIVQAAEKAGLVLQVAHILRYSPFFETLRGIIKEDRLGNIVNVDHDINVSFWHMVHAYVRGGWNRVEDTAPIILTKGSHDLDIIQWLLRDTDGQVDWLSSFGSLEIFKKENLPQPDIPESCLDGCPIADTCPFYAPYLYEKPLNKNEKWWRKVTLERDTEKRMDALRNGPYGRCVYYCDNTVVDHQSVSLMMESGSTVNLTLNGSGHEDSRTLRFDGTKATLFGTLSYMKNSFTIHSHRNGLAEFIPILGADDHGYGGADNRLIASFLDSVKSDRVDTLTSARSSLESHLLAFAAEEARIAHKTINMPEFREDANQQGIEASS